MVLCIQLVFFYIYCFSKPIITKNPVPVFPSLKLLVILIVNIVITWEVEV